MVREDLTPSRILTREAFENAIVVNSAIGGSTNCPPHIIAIARHIGVPLDVKDWETVGHEIPLLVNVQPAGEFLGEGYHRAGGVPAVFGELIRAGKDPHRRPDGHRQDDRRELRGRAHRSIPNVIRPYDKPAEGERRLPGGLRQSVRLRAGEDLRHQRGFPPPLPLHARHRRIASSRASSSSTARRITAPASTIRRCRSTNPACWWCAAPARSAIPARPKW